MALRPPDVFFARSPMVCAVGGIRVLGSREGARPLPNGPRGLRSDVLSPAFILHDAHPGRAALPRLDARLLLWPPLLGPFDPVARDFLRRSVFRQRQGGGEGEREIGGCGPGDFIDRRASLSASF